MKKYLCIGGKYPTNSVPAKHDLNTYTSKSTIEIKPEWVPRWYKVLYEKYLIVLKTERLLNG